MRRFNHFSGLVLLFLLSFQWFGLQAMDSSNPSACESEESNAPSFYVFKGKMPGNYKDAIPLPPGFFPTRCQGLSAVCTQQVREQSSRGQRGGKSAVEVINHAPTSQSDIDVNRSKRSGKADIKADSSVDSLNLREMFECVGSSDEDYLRTLQLSANFLLLEDRLMYFLRQHKKLFPLIPEIRIKLGLANKLAEELSSSDVSSSEMALVLKLGGKRIPLTEYNSLMKKSDYGDPGVHEAGVEYSKIAKMMDEWINENNYNSLVDERAAIAKENEVQKNVFLNLSYFAVMGGEIYPELFSFYSDENPLKKMENLDIVFHTFGLPSFMLEKMRSVCEFYSIYRSYSMKVRESYAGRSADIEQADDNLVYEDKAETYFRQQRDALLEHRFSTARNDELYARIYQEITHILKRRKKRELFSFRKKLFGEERDSLPEKMMSEAEFFSDDSGRSHELACASDHDDWIEHVSPQANKKKVSGQINRKKKKKRYRKRKQRGQYLLAENDADDVSMNESSKKFTEEVETSEAFFASKLEPNVGLEEATQQIRVKSVDESGAKVAYHPRVLRWFDNDFRKGKDFSSLLYHSFSLLADRYIFSLGVQTQWKNQTTPGRINTNYSLAGEIHYLDKNEKEYVVFSCCKDITGACYHRGFTKKEKSELFREYFSKNFWDVHFPELGFKLENEKALDALPLFEDGSFVTEDTNLFVSIYDVPNQVKLILYKL